MPFLSSLICSPEASTTCCRDDEDDVLKNSATSLNHGDDVFFDAISCSENSVSQDFTEDEDVSHEGTIIASLSSRDVARNVAQSAIASLIPRTVFPGHQFAYSRNYLSEVATVETDIFSYVPAIKGTFEPRASMAIAKKPKLKALDHKSDELSFTPTMAEMAFSFQRQDEEKMNPFSDDVSTIGITDIHPAVQKTCPFCERERDFQKRLLLEREQSQDMKISAYKSKYLLISMLMTVAIGILSFFLGKRFSDIQAEKMMAQYIQQCNQMMEEREADELYWRLVSATFNAIANAMAGPLANFVLGGGGGTK